MKAGDLVRIMSTGEVGLLVRFVSFEEGKNPQPVLMINGRLGMYGHSACEVISENKPLSGEVK